MHNDTEIITIRRTKGHGDRAAPNCSVTLAFVDFRVGGLMIFGASIVRNVDGTIHICAPRNDRSTGHATGAGFADKHLKAVVLEKAKAAFVALGGVLDAAPAPEPRNLRVSRIEIGDASNTEDTAEPASVLLSLSSARA